jgi:hypothetical protein
MIKFLQENWAVIVMAAVPFAEAIIRITPTKSDDTILTWIVYILDKLLPNKTKGDGSK